MLNRLIILIPLFSIVLSLSAVMYVALSMDPTKIESPLIDMPLPIFSKVDVLHPKKNVTKASLLGKVYLINVWASWCASCQLEHHNLLKYQKQYPFKLVGILYSDHISQVLPLLVNKGNPYSALVDDPNGDFTIKLGVYGTPETLLIDENGFVMKRFIGVITDHDWNDVILPELKKSANTNNRLK